MACAHRLAEKGLKPVVFEKEAVAGGRIQYAAVIGSKDFQEHLMSLVEEMGLDEMSIPLKEKEIGFFGEDFLPLEKFPSVLKEALSEEQMREFQEFSQMVNSLSFDPFSPSQELLKVRDKSLAEYGENLSEEVKNMAFAAAWILSGKDDLSEISADYGLHLIRMGNEVMSGEALRFEELNMMSLTNVLLNSIGKSGGEVLTGCEAKKVSKKEEGFEIDYRKLDEEKTMQVDRIVFALPLPEVSKIFPEVEIPSGVFYPENRIILAQGKLKYPKRRLLMGLPGNAFNLRLFLNFVEEEQYFLPWNKNEEIDLGFIYDDYEIISEEEILPLPCLRPDPKVPELETSIKGVYLTGDFYYYPYDTSIHTAEVVAEKISEE